MITLGKIAGVPVYFPADAVPQTFAGAALLIYGLTEDRKWATVLGALGIAWAGYRVIGAFRDVSKLDEARKRLSASSQPPADSSQQPAASRPTLSIVE